MSHHLIIKFQNFTNGTIKLRDYNPQKLSLGNIPSTPPSVLKNNGGIFTMEWDLNDLSAIGQAPGDFDCAWEDCYDNEVCTIRINTYSQGFDIGARPSWSITANNVSYGQELHGENITTQPFDMSGVNDQWQCGAPEKIYVTAIGDSHHTDLSIAVAIHPVIS